MTPTRMAEEVGRVLGGRYRLIAPIGAGASARVYLADDVTLRRRVAVKILHDGLAGDETFLRRFRAEAQAAAKLNHANLVAVHDWGEDEHGPFLVTEYLGGGSLRAMLEQGTLLTPSQVLTIGLEASRGLDHAHRRSLVHRDVKPANLLFDDESHLRIADFGVARALAEAAWTEPQGVLVGSARYASPEQARGEPVDGRADVYALALVMVEAVTGVVPFAGEDPLAMLMTRVDTPIPVPAELGRLADVVASAGHHDPAQRPDAASFGQALWDLAPSLPNPPPLPLAGTGVDTGTDSPSGLDRTLHHGDGVPAPGAGAADVAAPTPAPTTGRRRRWPRLVIALLIVALLAGGAAFFTNLLLESHVVPNLIGQSEEQATAVLGDESLGWEIQIDRRYADDTQPGQVLDLDPPPGERLREGGTIRVVVSRGPTPVVVPTDIVGQTLEEAGALLGTAGLRVGTVTTEFHETVAKDLVLTWSYQGTDVPAEVPRGEPVDLVVSSGPSPRQVPIVAGLTFDEAKDRLEQAGLVAVEAKVFSSDVESGKVIGTTPPAGSEVERGFEVTVEVSKGPDLVTVPNVAGDNLETAIKKLERAGLEVTDIEGNPSRQVLATDPPEGERVPRGSGVVIIMRGFLID